MTTFLFSLASLLVLSSHLDADTANKLTPEEIAEGRLLLFDGSTTFGWTVTGKAAATDGALVLGGDQDTTATTTTAYGRVILSLEAQLDGAKSLKIAIGGDEVELPAASGGAKWAKSQYVRDAAAARGPIQIRVPAGVKLSLRNVQLLPLGLKPLFNGKDLTGWKDVPGSKAMFKAVDSEVNLKNGPGDLQTTEQWADFVLQLDIKTRGPQMNSGVLLRGQPDQYGSGYEVQVRNQWQGDDRTRVVDYGTGGIHNHAPARKAVANDGGWFTMTIFAEGKHLAVWVNGYQVCDFSDTRPPGRTAAQGSKVDKGPIVLHGDDRNLDVSFKNIKLGELPKAK